MRSVVCVPLFLKLDGHYSIPGSVAVTRVTGNGLLTSFCEQERDVLYKNTC